MTNKILSPTMLWSDFDDSQPIQCTVLEERAEEKAVFRRLRFFGRSVGDERVNIYALCAEPLRAENIPALLIMPDCIGTVDEALARRFAEKGYAVLMPDYRGEWEGTEEYTIYPAQVEYANFVKAGRHMDFADETAKETSWYEWTALARYCIRYLRSLPQIGKIGAIGLKAGGDVVWQLAATCSELSCAIPVCSGGWRAYAGISKFGDSTELKMDDERYRFLAGVDAQAYAQAAQCPVLMLCSTNDTRFDADRAFDTFARITPEVEKTFYFAVRYDGRIGNTGLNDLDLFIDKHLKGRAVFVPSPADITIEEDEGELVARVKFDRNGEVKYCDVFMAEDRLESPFRNWTKCSVKREEGEDEQIFSLNAYKSASRVFAFAKAKYSCGFAVSSKIAVKKTEKTYANMVGPSRILYDDTEGTDSLTLDKADGNVLAGCFLDTSTAPIFLAQGPGGIAGVGSPYGLRTYKIGDERFRPAENALLKFDIYCPSVCVLQVTATVYTGGKTEKYSCNLRLSGGDRWTNHILAAKDFKSEINKPMSQLRDAVSLSFDSADKFLLNNLLWL